MKPIQRAPYPCFRNRCPRRNVIRNAGMETGGERPPVLAAIAGAPEDRSGPR
jgi:hypothetical protein